MRIVLHLCILLVIICYINAHNCIHDDLNAPKRHLSQVTYKNHPFDASDEHEARHRRLESYETIRFSSYFYKLDISQSKQNFLRNNLIPAALNFLTSALKVVPVHGPLHVDRTCSAQNIKPGVRDCVVDKPQTCGDVIIPDEHLGAASDLSGDYDSGAGFPNTDTIVYITAQATSLCSRNAGTMAYASACRHDQNSRPTVLYTNFCPNMIDETSYQSMLATAIHEIFHGLGFSANDFMYFIDQQGNTKPMSEVYETVINEDGSHVNMIVAPEPLQYARETFGCSEMTGVALENRGGSGTSNSHWKKLYYFDDFMSGVDLGEVAMYTKLSFAVLETSGWYQVDYSQLDIGKWGRGRGCAFQEYSDCINSSGHSTMDEHICDDSTRSKSQCTWDKRSIGNCGVLSYSSGSAIDIWFPSSPSLGGFDIMGFCPFINPYIDRNCMGNANEDSLWYSDKGERAQVHGSAATSGCFPSSLYYEKVEAKTTNQAGCYEYTCDCAKTQLKITVHRKKSSQSKVCRKNNGGTIIFDDYTGSIQCPDSDAEYSLYCDCRSDVTVGSTPSYDDAITAVTNPVFGDESLHEGFGSYTATSCLGVDKTVESSFKITTTGISNIQFCLSECEYNCYGVEYNAIERECDMWIVPIGHVNATQGHACYVKQDVELIDGGYNAGSSSASKRSRYNTIMLVLYAILISFIVALF